MLKHFIAPITEKCLLKTNTHIPPYSSITALNHIHCWEGQPPPHFNCATCICAFVCLCLCVGMLPPHRAVCHLKWPVRRDLLTAGTPWWPGVDLVATCFNQAGSLWILSAWSATDKYIMHNYQPLRVGD